MKAKSTLNFGKLVNYLKNGPLDSVYNIRLKKFKAWKYLLKKNPKKYLITWNKCFNVFELRQLTTQFGKEFHIYKQWKIIDSTENNNFKEMKTYI